MTEIQAVVLGPATGTHASPELEPGPRTQGALWCSNLPFDEETRKPYGFQKESPDAKWTVKPYR